MDPSWSPFQQNLPPVQLSANDLPTQESTLNMPHGFMLPTIPLQQAQATHAAQAAAYASFLMEQIQARNHSSTQHPISTTPPHSTYNQPHFPTSQSESNSAKTPSVPPKVSNRKAPNWNLKEDEALCEAWVQRSENPIVGTGQTGDTLWFHIFEDFREKQSGTKRTQKGLENRWTAIHADVTKWRAIVNRVNRNHQSGTNMVDELGACYEVFKNDHGRDFKFYHCWQILQHSAKWHISPGEKSKIRPSRRSDLVNATPPPVSPMNDFADIGLDASLNGLPDTCVYPPTHIHVSDDSPSPATPTGPAPSCIRSEPLARPLGRKSAKEKRRRSDNNASDEASMRNKRLSDQVHEWRISQNSQFQIMQEANKAQFESLKAANEVQAFHLVRKTKLEALQSSIAIVQAIGEAEEKIINRAPHLLTSEEVTDVQISRLKKLRDLERQHDEIQQLEYSPGGSASRRLNNDRSNMNPCNLENRFNSSFNSGEED